MMLTLGTGCAIGTLHVLSMDSCCPSIECAIAEGLAIHCQSLPPNYMLNVDDTGICA
eukprot:NODE_3214_length_583_cov_104.372659_g2700_i0.p1 GENE.NODE_3214_length_583_cov_104.372659_g2700_i0~~NODE_3214_length_583_cov_104.372659_g2700_i0.p1  ORF type:complete len:57 (+),score=2.00 NODE_3214_length_583_cov_104.372659_g2700_i0:362-532(+)